MTLKEQIEKEYKENYFLIQIKRDLLLPYHYIILGRMLYNLSKITELTIKREIRYEIERWRQTEFERIQGEVIPI